MEPLDPATLPLDRDLGACLALLRSVRRWTQRELAARAEVRATTLSHIEDGRQRPEARTLERLLRTLGFSYTHLDLARQFIESLDSTCPPIGGAHRLRAAGAPWSGPDPAEAELGWMIDRCMQGLSAITLASVETPSASEAGEGLGGAEDLTAASVGGAGLAEELWAELTVLSLIEQRARVRSDPKFASAALCELLCDRSETAATRRPLEARHLARLAVAVAAAVESQGRPAGLIRALAKGHEANALRVCGRLEDAESAMRVAIDLASAPLAGEEPPRYRLRLLDLEASLRRGQRRIEESVALLDQALVLSAPGAVRGRLLVKRARAFEELGDLAASIADLRAAHALIDPAAEPHLHLCVLHNLADALSKSGHCEEARALLPEVRKLSARLGNELDLVRLDWVEGRVAAGLGEGERAVELLTRVRGAFASRGIDYDTALVTLELAVVLLGMGRTAEVKTLARHLVPIFHSQKIHREALAALAVFRQAAEREALSAEAARGVADFLNRARFDPALAFAGSG